MDFIWHYSVNNSYNTIPLLGTKTLEKVKAEKWSRLRYASIDHICRQLLSQRKIVQFSIPYICFEQKEKRKYWWFKHSHTCFRLSSSFIFHLLANICLVGIEIQTKCHYKKTNLRQLQLKQDYWPFDECILKICMWYCRSLPSHFVIILMFQLYDYCARPIRVQKVHLSLCPDKVSDAGWVENFEIQYIFFHIFTISYNMQEK